MAVTFTPGSLLQNGRYIVAKPLGQGEMAMTYMVQDTHLNNKQVVLKVLLSGSTTISDWKKDVENFQGEIAMLTTLDHPLIPHMIDHFQEGQYYYMVQAYVEGMNLEDLLALQSLPLAEFDVLAYTSEILDALDHLANQQPPIVHGDIKPANIIISSKDHRAHLVDFSITSITVNSEQKQTSPLGIPRYAPPEQYQGRAEARSDLYALAATMHHLLTKQDPQNEDPFSYEAVRHLNAQISVETENLLKKALAMDIAVRFASARVMKQEVDAILIRRFGSQRGNVVSRLVHSLLPGHSAGNGTGKTHKNYVLFQNGVATTLLSLATRALPENTSATKRIVSPAIVPPGATRSSLQSSTHSIYSFSGSRLTLENLYANVRIVPHTQDNQIHVEIEGSSKILKQIKASQVGSAVVLSGDDNQGGNENSIIRNGRNIVISNKNGVVIRGGGSINVTNINGQTWVNGRLVGGGGNEHRAEITVTVPQQTAMDICEVNGKIEVGDVAGYVDLVIAGSGDVSIANTAGGSIEINGRGNCVIDHLSGRELNVSIKGSGDVRIYSGNVDWLQGSIMGSGDIYCDQLVVGNASLRIEGSGDIYVYHVIGQLSRNVVGSGDIHVEYRG